MGGDLRDSLYPSTAFNPRLVWTGACLFAVGLIVAFAYAWGERTGIRALRQGVEHRLDIYAGGLQSELTRYDYLPGVLSLNKDVIALLQDPGNPQWLARVNHYLETVNRKAGSSEIYVMDMEGLTLAASNWNRPPSFVGRNFSYRPYFIDAAKGLPGRFYGIGTVSHTPGYYFSYGIYHDGKMLGVAAVKVDLDKLDDAWLRADEKVLVVDENGVIFLTSVPAWKFKTLAPLSPHTMERLAVTRQYHRAGSLAPLGMAEISRLPDGTRVIQFASEPGQQEASGNFLQPSYLLQSRPIPGTQWKLMALSNIAPIHARARNTAIAAALAMGFLSILVLYLQQRRRTVVQSLAASAALQRAHDQLERKVAARTEALSNANRHLQTEIAERRRAEEELKSTMEELVQAGKMAALGQMAASITHELNQPLAALRTLADNAAVLLQRGRLADAEENLAMIGQLTGRMGKITGQLKKFARKSPALLKPTSIAVTVAEACFLLEQRLRQERITLKIDVPEHACAYCDGNRLEQVLVNLLGNAIDAMMHSDDRQMEIQVRQFDDWVSIAVRDSGPGIPDELMHRLFEPFFTTKEPGAGLGLGLAISAGIVRDFGGILRAHNRPEGGAAFVLQLRPAKLEETVDV
ncbi:MAG: ATP-binding protein [Pigmentiphaga sp.]|uniref:sensor histidine kinase n=1 Tax=Pigmentiphaga sp. TaxID=1977564 RepID=UPI0029B64265|nr:ATP-binding protein [Pigmentiphaga sp.]MDX3907320.1 ATP-binding protein [Pigmentiphaga sp.]